MNLHYSDTEFVNFEAALRKCGNNGDVWRRRVALYLTLVPHREQPRRFRFGVSGAFMAVLREWMRAKRSTCVIPPAKYFFLVFGAISKEYDSLKPVARALSERGHPVTVLWVADGAAVLPEMLENWGGSRVVRMSPADLPADNRLFLFVVWFRALKITLRAALVLRHQGEILQALWKERARVVSRLAGEQLWVKFFCSRFKACDFHGVAFVADTSEPGEALALYARKRHWISHHFLHGFTNLVHTRTLADRVYCFSSVERDLFIESGWPAEKVFSDGHPRQENIIAEISKRRVIPPEKGGLRILFACQGVDGDFDEWHHRGSMETVFRSVNALKLDPKAFRIRLHPAGNRAFDLTVCQELSIHPDRISLHTVAEDLAWANVLITPWSTMAVEAAYAGCMLVWIAVGTFQFAARERLITAGYGEKVTTADELISLLQRCQDDAVRSQLIKAMVDKSRSLGILNPRAADAAADRMEAAQ